jgi:hypothetical protein
MLTGWMLLSHWTVAFESTSAPLMAGALALLGAAAAVDLVGLDTFAADLAQNLAKFVGIALWLAFHLTRVVDLVRVHSTAESS